MIAQTALLIFFLPHHILTINYNIIVNAIVSISNEEEYPKLGQNYTLVCNVHWAEDNSSTVNYQWIKINSSQTYYIVENNSSTLFISHFKLSDVGEYLCQVTAYSSYLNYFNATESLIVTYQSEYAV